LLSLVVAKLSDLKNSQVFCGPPCILDAKENISFAVFNHLLTVIDMQTLMLMGSCHANYTFHCRQNSETFDVLHAFLSLVIAKLSDLKNSPVFFGPPCTVSQKTGRYN